VRLEIGTGSVQLGDFSIIDWADGPYFIKTEIDPTGGTNYTITGISQFMSVPFALYAETSGSSIPGPAGTQGSAGVDGLDGVSGAQGSTGLTGADGIDGQDGAAGVQWPAGLDGANGADGANGIDGADGVDAPVYSAGTGIDITSGVISATASGSAPEFLFVQPDAIVSGYVGFGSASAVNGIAYNSVTDEFTLKAGKTYTLDGAVYMHTTTSSNTYSFVFYDKTNNSSIGLKLTKDRLITAEQLSINLQ
jgi:hypothetical protein